MNYNDDFIAYLNEVVPNFNENVQQGELSSEPEIGFCSPCSIRNGFTLLLDNTLIEYSTPDDAYIDDQCPNNYQCAEQNVEDHYTNSTPGCCEQCHEDQYCPSGAIALRDWPESNICPDGYICENGLNITKTMCPEGTMCSYNRLMNCTIAVNQSFFREIFQGTYCKEGTAILDMCEGGNYCPNQETVIECPSGSFCMRKSKTDWLDCPGCDEGEEDLQRDPTIFMFILFLIVLVAFVKLMKYLDRNGLLCECLSDPFRKIENLFTCCCSREEEELQIDEEILQEKELKILENATNYNFDYFDTGNKGFITFDDLNASLKLSEAKFSRFKYMMLLHTTDKISRDDFIEYFPEALYCAQFMEPSEDDVKELFKDMDTEDKHYLVEKQIYHSRLSLFLEEGELNALVKKFELKKRKAISEEDFIAKYAHVLKEITASNNEKGTDIVFHNLRLVVPTGTDTEKIVVNNVTGEIPAQQMTAVMGGSGSGKTSLLSSLCGRAFYGKVTGQIYINGHEGKLDDIKSLIGFVPQDDIVYAELTVYENFLFAGRFRLPPSTPSDEITDLADEVCANLGLGRIKDTIVGDVRRRGVSGGEKKRVNIGLELMARPKILFLDEPTSGLDSSSSSMVMHALKLLTIKNRITICSVIHQPRKYVFEQFDNLILLAAGGFLTYCGPVNQVQRYFENFGYELPPGENVADFMLDVVTGYIQPKNEGKDGSGMRRKSSGVVGAMSTIGSTKVEALQYDFGKEWLKHKGYDDISHEDVVSSNIEAPEVRDLPVPGEKQSFYNEFKYQIMRRLTVMQRTRDEHISNFIALAFGSAIMTLLAGMLEPVEKSPDEEDINNYVPGYLTFDQLYRTLVVPLNNSSDINNFTESALCNMYRYPEFVRDAVVNMINYSYSANSDLNKFMLQVGLVATLLLAIAASNTICSKKIEFFREAGSGYTILPFYLAVTVIALIEVTVQMFFVALLCLLLRGTIASHEAFIWNFLTLAWDGTAWGIFYSTWVDPSSVVPIIGLHCIIGAFLSGCSDALERADIYDNPVLNLVSSFMSPMRFFSETYDATEEKCLQPQSGFASKVLYLFDETNFDQLSIGVNDPNITLRSCDGWYWNFLPQILVVICILYAGGMALHIANRPKMFKKSFRESMKTDEKFRKTWLLVLFAFLLLVVGTAVSILAERGKLDEELYDENVFCSLLGVSQSSCSTYFEELESSGFFDRLFNVTNTTEEVSMPEFCEGVLMDMHNYRNFELNPVVPVEFM